jgi:pimeloyl-ACP methyl ester carboxylesterase
MSHPRSLETGRPVIAGDVRLWTSVEGSGRRVLVVHGGPGLDHNLVLPLTRRLATSFEVWSPDLPGHGRSARDDGKTPGLRQLQDRLATWIANLPFRFDAVIGHSLGAWLVREILRHGELDTSAVVLVSPPASGQSGHGSSLRRAVRVAGVASSDPDPGREIRRHLEAECGGRLPDGAREILDAARLVHVSRFRGLVRNLHKRLTSPPRPFSPSCPVLVVVGTDDRTTPVEHATAVAAKIEGARLEVLDELGHYPFFQDADRVASVIVDFLAESTG